jgi:thiamine pyrophosphokinase
MNQNIIAIIANGEPVSGWILQRYTKDTDVIIAADGGVKTCLSGGIKPDVVAGDFDSIDIDPADVFPDATIEQIADQDSTDLEKAINISRRYKPGTLRFFSILGLRADHTMANMIIVQNYNPSVHIEVYDNHGKMIRLLAGSHRLKTEKGKTVSLFSMQPVQNLTLEGFRYPLHKHSASPSFFGISNVYESDTCRLSLDSGSILLYELY